MDSRYRTGGDIGNVSFTGPLAYRDLKALTPVNTYLESNDTLLGGYDIEYSRLIFEEMLGLNITFIASGTFAEMYLDMRDGSRCDVSISAAEMDPSRHVARVRCQPLSSLTSSLRHTFAAPGLYAPALVPLGLIQ